MGSHRPQTGQVGPAFDARAGIGHGGRRGERPGRLQGPRARAEGVWGQPRQARRQRQARAGSGGAVLDGIRVCATGLSAAQTGPPLPLAAGGGAPYAGGSTPDRLTRSGPIRCAGLGRSGRPGRARRPLPSRRPHDASGEAPQASVAASDADTGSRARRLPRRVALLPRPLRQFQAEPRGRALRTLRDPRNHVSDRRLR